SSPSPSPLMPPSRRPACPASTDEVTTTPGRQASRANPYSKPTRVRTPGRPSRPALTRPAPTTAVTTTAAHATPHAGPYKRTHPPRLASKPRPRTIVVRRGEPRGRTAQDLQHHPTPGPSAPPENPPAERTDGRPAKGAATQERADGNARVLEVTARQRRADDHP